MTTLSCEAAREELEALHYGDLPAGERQAVERHLEGCPPCREALLSVRETASRLDGFAVPEPSEAQWAHMESRLEARIAPARALRMARTFGQPRFFVLRRVAAAFLIAGLGALAAGLYFETRDQQARITVLDREIADLSWERGDIRRATERYRALRVTAQDPVVARRVEAGERVDERAAQLYARTREAGAEQEIRERIGELLACYPHDRLADQAYIAQQKTGLPTPPPLEQAVLQPVPLLPARTLPGESPEATLRRWIDTQREIAARSDARVGAFALLRAGNAAEEQLRDPALARELYTAALRLSQAGPLRSAAEERLAGVGR